MTTSTPADLCEARRNEGLESRMMRKCAPRNAVLNPWRSQEKLGGKFLGHLVYLTAKARGEKSTPEKRETPEGAYGAVPQDPRDKAKATLPESQSPVVELHTRCDSVYSAAPQEPIVQLLRWAPSAWRGDGERLHSRG